MQTPDPKPRRGQTAYNLALADVSLRLALQELTAIASAPVIEEHRLEALRTHLGRANGFAAKLANEFGKLK